MFFIYVSIVIDVIIFVFFVSLMVGYVLIFEIMYFVQEDQKICEYFLLLNDVLYVGYLLY